MLAVSVCLNAVCFLLGFMFRWTHAVCVHWSPFAADSPLSWAGVLCGLRPLQEPQTMAGGHGLLRPPHYWSPVSAAAPYCRGREGGGLWHGSWSCFGDKWRRCVASGHNQ